MLFTLVCRVLCLVCVWQVILLFCCLRDAMCGSQGSLLTESKIIMDEHSINPERIRRVLDALEFHVE